MKFEVINYDKRGNLIKDMSKVELPEDKQRQVIKILCNSKHAINKEGSHEKEKEVAK